MRAPRGILFLYAIDVFLGALAGTSYVVTQALGASRIDLFRLGAESNLPTWYSTSQLLLIALVLGALAWRDVDPRNRRTWVLALPTLLFVLLSMDEGAMLHERLGFSLERAAGAEVGLRATPWMLLGVPLYAALAVASFKAAKRYLTDRPDVVRLLWIGGGLFAASAVGLELIGDTLLTHNAMGQRVIGVFEEVGEMAAATTLLWAALRLARWEGLGIQFNTPSPLAMDDDGPPKPDVQRQDDLSPSSLLLG
ncbi:MAG: hypothetical protein AAF170_16175 [Bacteroidota bacterium]